MSRSGPHSAETLERMRASAVRSWTDPEIRARRAAAISAAARRPGAHERRSEICRRGAAKGLVRKAGLPLLRQLVDRALDMLADGNKGEVIIDALQRETRAGRRG